MTLDPRHLLGRSAIYRGFTKLVAKRDTRGRVARDFLKVRPKDRVLDIGCGPATIIEHLPDDIEYHGYDMEPRYIQDAQAKYGARGNFTVKAVSRASSDDNGLFDVAIATGVLHHLTDEECDDLFAGAAKVLKPGGRLVTLDGVYQAGQNPIAKLMLKLDRGRYVRERAGYVELAKKHFNTVDATILDDLIAIPYNHIIMEMRDQKPAAPKTS